MEPGRDTFLFNLELLLDVPVQNPRLVRQQLRHVVLEVASALYLITMAQSIILACNRLYELLLTLVIDRVRL